MCREPTDNPLGFDWEPTVNASCVAVHDTWGSGLLCHRREIG